jgi:hypothetical protein
MESFGRLCDIVVCCNQQDKSLSVVLTAEINSNQDTKRLKSNENNDTHQTFVTSEVPTDKYYA